MSIEYILEMPANAAYPIDVTDCGIVVFEQLIIKQLEEEFMIALQLFLESYIWLPFSTIMEARLEHPEKEVKSMLVTEAGIVMELIPVLENAATSIVVTELDIVTDFRFVQFSKAPYPTIVIELGREIDVKFLQLSKARKFILRIELEK